MYTQTDIEEAVAAGALAPQQAANLRDFVASRNGAPTADEEYVGLVRGFNDFFTAYACLAALVAAGMIGLLAPITAARIGFPGGIPILTPILVAAGAWGLSELFLRRGRFALVGIVLVLALALGAFAAVLFLMALLLIGAGSGSPITVGVMASLSALVAAALTFAHWRRFRVPFAVFAYLCFGVIGVLALVFGLLAINPAGATILAVMMLLLGIGLFAYGVHVDGRDPGRITAQAEVGLWIHWLAAGMISWSLMYLIGAGNGVPSAGIGIVVVLLYLVFAVAALVVDRRQLLLAALTPLTGAFSALFGGPGGRGGSGSPFGQGFGGPPPGYGGSNPFAASPAFGRMGGTQASTTGTMIAIAVILMTLALAWRPIRAGLLSALPQAWRARLPAARPGVAAETYTFQ